jgi:ABC-type Na+ efflux pump permease subunit
LALGLADGGSRRGRRELTWLAYTTLVLVAAKILFQDVRQGHLIFIAASFFLYAATLLLLPRLAGQGRKEQTLAEVNP